MTRIIQIYMYKSNKLILKTYSFLTFWKLLNLSTYILLGRYFQWKYVLEFTMHNMTEVLQKGQKRYPGYFNTKYNFFGIFLPIFMLEIIPFENFLIIWKLTNFYYINGWFLEWFQITPKNNHLLNKNMTIFKESKSSQRACFLTWI